MARRKTPATRKRSTIADLTTVDIYEHQCKIRKRAQGSSSWQQDRLSELPEPLKVNILSLLEMRDAVKTGLLSKKWNNLWTQVDNVVYQRPRPGKKYNYLDMTRLEILLVNQTTDKEFISFVDCTLMKHTANIKSFTLEGLSRWWSEVDFDKWIDKWIAYVVEKKVENFRLETMKPTPCLFQSCTITKLELLGIRVYTPTTVCLSALKNLRLVQLFIDDDFIEKILIGSPMLENMVLRDCNICRLNIMSPSVKMLEIWNRYRSDQVFNIKAPWLQELKISGNFTSANCELVDVSSLLKATLTIHTHFHNINQRTKEMELNDYMTKYNDSWIPMVTKLLKSLSYVGELIIGSELIQVLHLLKLSGTPIKTLFRCKHLTIETCLWKFDLPGITCLLEITPNLESLLIKVVPVSLYLRDGYQFYQAQKIFQIEDQHWNKPSRKFSHLKNVEVKYLEMPCHDNIKDNQGGHFEFELAEYILKSAVVLERLALCSPRGWNCSDSSCLVPNCSYQYVSSLCSKLLITIMNITGSKADGWELKRSKNKSESEFTFSNYASLLSTASSL